MKKLLPDISEVSIYNINYKKLKKDGIKCLAFDLDNTLTDIRGKDAAKQLVLIEKLKKMGFECIVLSNNIIKSRVKHWGDALGIDYIYAARKPRRAVYTRILEKYKIKPNELACIGDQLLTDIWGANKIGATSILVNPVEDRDEVVTLLGRFIESLVIKSAKKKGIVVRKY